jgi:MATE family multidrug resistance protein
MGTGALASFFVGRGETKIIPLVTLVFNALNIILDFLLIWGCRVTPGGQLEIISGHGISIPWFANQSGLTLIPEMGIIGAGMATIISQSLSALLLLIIFSRKSHRERYDTGNWALNFSLMKKCLKAGFPNMLSHLVTLVALTLMTQAIIILTTPDDTHAYGIIHTIYCSISFICEGMAAGVRTVCSNAFGARQFDVIHKNIRSFLIICAVFTIVTSIGAVFFPDSLMSIFPEKMLEGNIHDTVRYMLMWIWLVFALDVPASCLMHLLLALGDTKIPMYIYTFSFLFVAILPSYIGIAYFSCKSVFFWQFIALNYVVCLILYTIRYRSKRLNQMKLI